MHSGKRRNPNLTKHYRLLPIALQFPENDGDDDGDDGDDGDDDDGDDGNDGMDGDGHWCCHNLINDYISLYSAQ